MRIGGDFGGIILIVMAGILVAGAITSVLGFLSKKLLRNSKGGQKVMNMIMALIWLATLVIIALDLLNIAPIIRNILFSLLGK